MPPIHHKRNTVAHTNNQSKTQSLCLNDLLLPSSRKIQDQINNLYSIGLHPQQQQLNQQTQVIIRYSVGSLCHQIAQRVILAHYTSLSSINHRLNPSINVPAPKWLIQSLTIFLQPNLMIIVFLGLLRIYQKQITLFERHIEAVHHALQQPHLTAAMIKNDKSLIAKQKKLQAEACANMKQYNILCEDRYQQSSFDQQQPEQQQEIVGPDYKTEQWPSYDSNQDMQESSKRRRKVAHQNDHNNPLVKLSSSSTAAAASDSGNHNEISNSPYLLFGELQQYMIQQQQQQLKQHKPLTNISAAQFYAKCVPQIQNQLSRLGGGNFNNNSSSSKAFNGYDDSNHSELQFQQSSSLWNNLLPSYNKLPLPTDSITITSSTAPTFPLLSNNDADFFDDDGDDGNFQLSDFQNVANEYVFPDDSSHAGLHHHDVSRPNAFHHVGHTSENNDDDFSAVDFDNQWQSSANDDDLYNQYQDGQQDQQQPQLLHHQNIDMEAQVENPAVENQPFIDNSSVNLHSLLSRAISMNMMENDQQVVANWISFEAKVPTVVQQPPVARQRRNRPQPSILPQHQHQPQQLPDQRVGSDINSNSIANGNINVVHPQRKRNRKATTRITIPENDPGQQIVEMIQKDYVALQTELKLKRQELSKLRRQIKRIDAVITMTNENSNNVDVAQPSAHAASSSVPPLQSELVRRFITKKQAIEQQIETISNQHLAIKHKMAGMVNFQKRVLPLILQQARNTAQSEQNYSMFVDSLLSDNFIFQHRHLNSDVRPNDLQERHHSLPSQLPPQQGINHFVEMQSQDNFDDFDDFNPIDDNHNPSPMNQHHQDERHIHHDRNDHDIIDFPQEINISQSQYEHMDAITRALDQAALELWVVAVVLLQTGNIVPSHNIQHHQAQLRQVSLSDIVKLQQWQHRNVAMANTSAACFVQILALHAKHIFVMHQPQAYDLITISPGPIFDTFYQFCISQPHFQNMLRSASDSLQQMIPRNSVLSDHSSTQEMHFPLFQNNLSNHSDTLILPDETNVINHTNDSIIGVKSSLSSYPDKILSGSGSSSNLTPRLNFNESKDIGDDSQPFFDQITPTQIDMMIFDDDDDDEARFFDSSSTNQGESTDHDDENDEHFANNSINNIRHSQTQKNSHLSQQLFSPSQKCTNDSQLFSPSVILH